MKLNSEESIDLIRKDMNSIMQISILLAEQIVELFLMILMGYVIVKLGLVTDDDSKILSKIVLYIVIPCVMINAFQIDYTPDKIQGMLLALVASVVLQVLLLIAVWMMGKEWVVFGCVFMAVQLIFMWTHGKYIISSGDRIDWRKIVLNINMIAIFIGAVLFLLKIHLPEIVDGTLIYKSKSIRSYISKTVACAGAGTDHFENQRSGYMASTS